MLQQTHEDEIPDTDPLLDRPTRNLHTFGKILGMGWIHLNKQWRLTHNNCNIHYVYRESLRE